MLLSGSTKDILKPRYIMGKAKEVTKEQLYSAPQKALSSDLHHQGSRTQKLRTKSGCRNAFFVCVFYANWPGSQSLGWLRAN
jgi:hypothetical protein